MFRTLILSASLGVSALVALVPSAASAQSYGRWDGQYMEGRAYGDGRYDRDRGYDDRGGYRDRQRWIAHRRWEQEQRRRDWRRHQWRDGDDRGYGRSEYRGRWDDHRGY